MLSSGSRPEKRDWKTWKRATEMSVDMGLCPGETELEGELVFHLCRWMASEAGERSSN